MIQYSQSLQTRWGCWSITVSEKGICRLAFGAPLAGPMHSPWREALSGYCQGIPIPDDLPIDLHGLPDFTCRVLLACRQIPYGKVVSYQQLAINMGRPTAARAVGQALGRNPIPIIIPCHRVIAANGKLRGFSAGLAIKEELLKTERDILKGNLGGDCL